MFSKFLWPVLIFSATFLSAQAQNCTIILRGIITTPAGVAKDVNVVLAESKNGTATNTKGVFELAKNCKGNYHLVVSFLGFETQNIHLNLQKDTLLYIELQPISQVLADVSISENALRTTQTNSSLSIDAIASQGEKNLANMLEEVVGVRSLKTGNNIAKPVVNGLYGNRLLIINNGIVQAGQQWGTDHSPEIDPLAAQKITVLKGASALAFQGSGLGSVILVAPEKIMLDPKLHGKASTYYTTNGRGIGTNMQLQKATKQLAWRAMATAKKSGDGRTPDYFLRNTGAKEANFVLQLEKDFQRNWISQLYVSSFNTELGILRGSHIGNISDLEEALTRPEPFYTQPNFSYSIDAPRQTVHHQLLKIKTTYFTNNGGWFDFTYAFQWNLRKEFDVRRIGYATKPALNLSQITNFAEAIYNQNLDETWSLQTGTQFTATDNTNNPETGILPLIPDYRSFENGVFIILKKQLQKWQTEFGARYDFAQQNVAAISTSLPREILYYHNLFHNGSASFGVSYQPKENWQASFNIGFAARNPAVNERYSNGLHQGTSAIEEGDPNLKLEKSVKATIGGSATIFKRLNFEFFGYAQNVVDYIFLMPQNEFRTTIRGTFPVFNYTQTHALLVGVDAAATYHFSELLRAELQYSYLYGQDIAHQIPLIYMPANNLFLKVDFRIAKIKKLENPAISLTNRYVFRQNRLLPNQDYVAAPAGYNLLGLRLSAEKQARAGRFTFFVSADNLGNVRYRDYLNTMRYYANDLGISVTLGCTFSF